MRYCDYDVNWRTTLKEICQLLDVNIEEEYIYKTISRKLKIIYTERSICTEKRISQSVCARSDHGNVYNFRSLNKAARFFNVDHNTIANRIRNNETIYLNGEIYTFE